MFLGKKANFRRLLFDIRHLIFTFAIKFKQSEKIMDKKTIGMIATVIAVMAVAILISAMPAEGTITKVDGVTVVNTQLIAKDIKGFNGPTPVKIFIENNKITKIETLPNKDTPKYFNRAKTLLSKYEGVPVNKAAKMEVDAVSGATFSSRGLIKNVQEGLKCYKKNK